MSAKITSFVGTIREVLRDTYPRYRGRVITVINSHCFTVGKETYTSMKDAEAGIDESYKALSNSIRR